MLHLYDMFTLNCVIFKSEDDQRIFSIQFSFYIFKRLQQANFIVKILRKIKQFEDKKKTIL